SAAFNDDALRNLAEIVGPEAAKLEQLDLTGSAVTDDGLLHLAKFSQLPNLLLASTGITDKGIETLQKVAPRLTTLHLGQTQITDTGIPLLEEFEHLVGLSVGPGAVTDSGL